MEEEKGRIGNIQANDLLHNKLQRASEDKQEENVEIGKQLLSDGLGIFKQGD